MADKEVVKVLKDARRLIRKGWTQGRDARDAEGNGISALNEGAVKFCAWGAISRAAEEQKYSPKFNVRQFLMRAIERITHRRTADISAYNDSPRRSQSQVLKAFDLAIQLAEKE